jgi:hypothetical protein
MGLQIRDDGGDSEKAEAMKSMPWCAKSNGGTIREMKSR